MPSRQFILFFVATVLLPVFSVNAQPQCDYNANQCWEQMMREGEVPSRDDSKSIEFSKLDNKYL